MAEDIQRIRAFLRGLVLRERLLLLVRVGSRAAVVWGATVLFLALVPHLRLDRATALLWLVVGAGIGTWVAAAWPLLAEWPRTGDPLRQAGRVEAVRPQLRGRLLTAVDGTRGAVEPERQALLSLVVGRAVQGIAGVHGGEVHRARAVLPAVVAGGGALLVALVGLAVLGPVRAVSYWFRGADGLAAAALEFTAEDAELAKVGDLVLRFTYPDYTGLEPKVVSNGTGAVEAPPGTVVEVAARAADVAEAAGLVAYDERLEGTLDPDGRGLHGQFTVRATEGVWRFTLYRGGESEASRDFAITPQQDLPPDVTLSLEEGAEILQIEVDRSFPVDWIARDDFGVRRVGLAIDGKEREPPVERPERRRAELGGRLALSPRELGLKAGDRVKLSIVAWDNDTVSGSKRGESRAVDLVVLGANGVSQQLEQRREELLEAMIPILADGLVDPWPPGESAGAVARWGEHVAGRYRPLTELTESLWRGMSTEGQDRAVVERVLATGRALVRYTQTAFDPGADTVPPAESFQMAARLRGEALVALEDGILALHRMLELQALGEVARQAEQLDTAAARMEEALARENPDAQELLAQLDQLERQMEALAREMAKMGESGLQEYLQSRQSEVQNLMDEIRKALAEGRMDEARELMKRLTELLKEMSQGVKDQMESRQQESDDAQDAAAELQAKLEQLEKDQRALQSEVQQVREEDRSADAIAALWEELAEKATQHRRDADRFRDGLVGAQRPFFERERSDSGGDAARGLELAVNARDVRGARGQVEAGRHAWFVERRAIEIELSRGKAKLAGPGRAEVAGLLGQLDEIEALLDRIEQASSEVDPATRERAQQLEQRQRELEQRMQEAMEEAKAVERSFPVRPQGMNEALQDGQQRMDQAAQDLQQGQPMQAEGSQGMAADRVREAAEALEQARRQAAEQMQQMQQPGGSGQEQGQQHPGEGEKEGRQLDREELEIPGREEFQTPEEYRRALLEGMEGEVPEEYRAMKKRYFEELVSQ